MKKTLFCIGLGAGAMYLFDPEQGEDRRSMLRDKLSGRMPKTTDAISAKAEAISAKAHDISAQADAKAAEVITTVGPPVEGGDSDAKPEDAPKE